MQYAILATVIGVGAFVLYKHYKLLDVVYGIQRVNENYGRHIVKLYGEITQLGIKISEFKAVLKDAETKLEQFAPDCYWGKIEAMKILEDIMEKHLVSKSEGDDSVSQHD